MFKTERYKLMIEQDHEVIAIPFAAPCWLIHLIAYSSLHLVDGLDLSYLVIQFFAYPSLHVVVIVANVILVNARLVLSSPFVKRCYLLPRLRFFLVFCSASFAVESGNPYSSLLRQLSVCSKW